MTRSHHFLSAEANKLPAIHIAGNDGVTYVNVYRRSLLSNRTFQKLAPSTCAARKDSAVHVSLSSSSLVKQPGSRGPHPSLRRVSLYTFDDEPPSENDRLGLHSSQWKSFKGATPCRGQEPRRCRAQWPVYKPARSGLSTPDVNKSSHAPKESPSVRKPLFFRASRAPGAGFRRHPAAPGRRGTKKFPGSRRDFFVQCSPMFGDRPAARGGFRAARIVRAWLPGR